MDLGGGHLARQTNKAGIVGKHRDRYGASLGKTVKKMKPPACQAHLLLLWQNQDGGIWRCGSCVRTAAGGAWTFTTTSADTVKAAVRKKTEGIKDQEKHHHLITLPNL